MKIAKISLLTGGSLATAFLSFLPLACCVFPVAFTFLGLGSLAFAEQLHPYRPYFIALTFIFLGAGFYFAYRPQKEECTDGDTCAKPESRKIPRIILWIATVLTVVIIALPYLSPYFPT